MIFPSKQDYARLAAQHDIVPVYKELLADKETPVSMLERFAHHPNAFLLESMEGGEKWGRYSFVGINPALWLETSHSQGPAGKLDGLRDIFKGLRVAEIQGLPRFFGGTVGFLSYEAIGEFERMPLPKSQSPSASSSCFLQADRLIVFDNVRHTLKIVICTRPQGLNPAALYAETCTELNSLADEIRTPLPHVPPVTTAPVHFESNLSEAEYIAMVRKAKDYIYAGDIIQAVLSRKFTAECTLNPLQVYRALRFLNPSPYTFFLRAGKQTLVGSSPEVMVRLTGNRVELRPIAGTRPRGATEQQDRLLADELLADEKEKAEHVMLVDLGRNDLGRISESGSVQLSDYMMIERYSHVMHMVSHVEGILKKEFDALDVIRATFPAGTLSGAPKIRAMQIIHELEPEARGVYGGAVGYISYGGNMDLAITIRTLENRGSRWTLQSGAGIVYDSDPQREYEETSHKAGAMIQAMQMAAGGLEIPDKGNPS